MTLRARIDRLTRKGDGGAVAFLTLYADGQGHTEAASALVWHPKRGAQCLTPAKGEGVAPFRARVASLLTIGGTP